MHLHKWSVIHLHKQSVEHAYGNVYHVTDMVEKSNIKKSGASPHQINNIINYVENLQNCDN